MAKLRLDNLKSLNRDFVVANETLKRVVKDDALDRIEVEIGDSKQPDFKPQFKISRWNNEANFSIRAEERADAITEIDKGVVKYKTADFEVHQYEKPEAGEDGGFEFEWYLPSKPESNVLKTTIRSKNLRFHYQPELTDQEIKNGLRRPENVVGSYAVYHKSGRDNHYKTGKAFHIYRPEAVDAAGNKTWCDLQIHSRKGELVVVVPQEFLDNAQYPVIVDPTFGYTSIGASATYLDNTSAHTAGIVQAQTAETATYTTIAAALFVSPSPRSGRMKYLIYSDNAGEPDALLSSGQSEIFTNNTAEWKFISVSESLTAGAIWLGATGLVWDATSSSQYCSIALDTTGGNCRRFGTDINFFNYSTPNNPWVTHTSPTYNLSLYAEYTEPPSYDFDFSLRNNGINDFDIALQDIVYDPKVETLTDDFANGSLSPEWDTFTNNSGSLVESGGVVTITNPVNGTTSFYSSDNWTLFESFMTVEVVSFSDNDVNQFAWLNLYAWDGAAWDSGVQFRLNNGVLRSYLRISGSLVQKDSRAYDPDVHKFLRFREAAGVTYWEYSTDGTSWTVLHSEATSIDFSQVYPEFFIFSNGSAVNTATLVLDNINLEPSTGGGTCLAGWTYKKEITIAGSADGALTDFVIPVVVNYGSGTDSGRNVYLAGNCETDFADIRFTAADGVTQLSHYLDQKIDSDKALFLVKIPSIPADPSTVGIYIQYGNDAATSASDGDATFEAFEDFEDSTFIFDTAGAIGVTVEDTAAHSPKEGSKVGVNNGSQGYKKQLDSAASFDDGYIVEVWAKILSGGGTNENLGAGISIFGTTGGVNNGYEALLDGRDAVSPQLREAWDNPSRNDGNYQVSEDTWYLINLFVNSGVVTTELYTEAQAYTGTPQTTTTRSDTTYTSGFAGISTYSANHTAWDGFRVRKWTPNEPTISAYGSQESCSGATTESVTKSLTYAVASTSSITKSLTYEVVASLSITKSLSYEVTSEVVITKSLGYEVTAEIAIQKNLGYLIETTASAIQKALQYVIAGGINVQKSLEYAIETTATVQKNLSYEIETSSQISKSLAYEVTSNQATTKSLGYEIVFAQQITKSLSYEIGQSIAVTKTLQYAVLVEGSQIAKSLSYAILLSPADTIELQLEYAIETTGSITKSLGYEVESSVAMQKSLRYAVFTQSTIEKNLSYEVQTEVALTKSLGYAIERSSAITKSMRYVFGAKPMNIQKSLTYVILNANYVPSDLYAPSSEEYFEDSGYYGVVPSPYSRASNYTPL